MITFKQFIAEARSAPLYHATSFLSGYSIAMTNLLKGETGQRLSISGEKDKDVYGVSLTRDFNFAKSWHNGIVDPSNRSDVIFQIDQQKLTHNHKIITIDFFRASKDRRETAEKSGVNKRRSYDFGTAEAEEFVVGGIKNFKKFVTKVYVNKWKMKDSFVSELMIDKFQYEWKVPVEKF